MSDQEAPEFTRKWVNLADARRGAVALRCSDEFFAAATRMLDAAPPVFVPGKYDDHGKWMDGWETRRKRGEGHDWCIVRLAYPGQLMGVDIDTSHFTGNFPPAASLEGTFCAGEPGEDAAWVPLLGPVNLRGNAQHFHALNHAAVYTHLRLNIFPDGGVARLRVYGRVSRAWDNPDRHLEYDLAALENGGRAVACNDQHFGALWNVIAPGRGRDMGDSWETRRRREPGQDWAIIALGHPGRIVRVEVDTAHHKGNYPDRCSLQAALVKVGTDFSLVTQSMFWPTLMGEQKLQMDQRHFFEDEIQDLGVVSHIRVNIIPDGGISRLRAYGRLA